MQSASEARYRPGDPVKVQRREPSGHCRTPFFIRGKEGRVVAVHGAFHNPESLAHGGSGLPKLYLYQVEFSQPQVWGRYEGPLGDKVWIDIYEHWLQPA